MGKGKFPGSGGSLLASRGYTSPLSVSGFLVSLFVLALFGRRRRRRGGEY